MPISQIGRQIQTAHVSATYSLTNPEIEQIIADATSAGFTITIYNDLQSGAYHRLVVKIAAGDVSGNTVTIVDAAAVLSTSLSTTSASVELETDSVGNWIAVANFPTTDATTALSASTSAGAAASAATSTSTVAASKATSAGALGAIASSEAVSAGLAGAVALSAATSGTTLATSEATSAGLKGTAALSAATSAGLLASSALSLASS